MQNMSCTIIILYNSHGSLPVQSVTCCSKTSNSAVTITGNKMDANNIDQWIIHHTMFHTSIGPKAPICLQHVQLVAHTPKPAVSPTFKITQDCIMPGENKPTCASGYIVASMFRLILSLQAV